MAAAGRARELLLPLLFLPLALPIVVWIGLGEAPLLPRLAALAGWVLIDLQALDPDAQLPSALIGTALAVGAVIATAAVTRAAAPSPRPTGSSR